LDQAIAVVDIGKTRSKLSLWTEDGTRLWLADYANVVSAAAPRQLDLPGVADWLKRALTAAGRRARITDIVPVAHGAAAVLMAGEAPLCALDYEAAPPPELAERYDRLRDPFDATLSPRLAGGLNLGVQFYWLEQLHPGAWPGGGHVLLWPQYWAWYLSGERCSEVTSLGCHSDLWRPLERRFSDLASSRGWAERLGPLRGAADVIGQIRPSLADELGLSRYCRIRCGLHDSNAALHAARGFAALAGRPFAVVSTGTWFVCMNAGGAGPATYDPAQDMLANVDVAGALTPTTRFMGGRDYEAWTADAALRPKTAAVELARRTDRALSLIAAEGPILLEGRFAADEAFAVALARIRAEQPVYRSAVIDGVGLGAWRLVAGHLRAKSELEVIVNT
jgi:sugar (pentulose or hexulose) kinase